MTRLRRSLAVVALVATSLAISSGAVHAAGPRAPYTVSQWTANSYPTVAIHQAAREFGASDYQLMTVARCESGYAPGAYNPSGASGLFQFMSGTFYGYSRYISWRGWTQQNISPWNALAAARVAAKMFTMGQQHQWSCAYITGII